MTTTSKTKVKSIENEEIVMAMTLAKIITTKIMIIIMVILRIKIGNYMKI